MKSSFPLLLTLLLSVVHTKAALTAMPGDLIASFYEVNGTSVTANTYMYNLGAGSALRDGSPTFTTDNLNADLTTAFGADWATAGNVRMLIVGVVGPGDAVTLGDNPRTIYYSRPEGTTVFTMTSPTLRATVANQLDSYASLLDGAGLPENGAVDGGAILASGAPLNVSSFLPPTSTTFFGSGLAPHSTITASGAQVDVFRISNTTSGAFEGSYRIDALGNLSSIPEPSVSLFLTGTMLLFGSHRRRNQKH